jgi:methylmalonyl-CoA mutase
LVSEARKLIDEVEALGGMTEAVSAGLPKLRILEAAARRQARIDQGEEVIVGVNRYQLDEEEQVEILSVDNIAVRDAQLRRLESVRLARDEDRCQAALQILEHAATKEEQNNNLLACAMDAARVRATVGEISTALEKVFGRHRAETITISGVYGAVVKDDKSFSSTQAAIRSFADRVGRQPRLLVAKLGQDGHDRGASVIATAFADLGFDVDIGPLFQTPADAVRQAVENDVHIIGISSQAAAHRTLIPEVMVELERQGASDIIVVLGGVIPLQDHAEMYKLGVAAIYGPGTHIPAAAQDIMDLLGQRQR